jgi:hypothetical protein
VLEAQRAPYVMALEGLAFPDEPAARPRPSGLGALKAMVANLAGGKQ